MAPHVLLNLDTHIFSKAILYCIPEPSNVLEISLMYTTNQNVSNTHLATFPAKVVGIFQILEACHEW